MKIDKKLLFIVSVTVVFLQFVFISFVLMKRIGAFGCFDDCHNFVTGYFMLKGRQIYSEIFYNHQMIMPFISYIIQAVTSPDSLYSLVQYHRIFVISFSFIASAGLILRFKWRGVLFSLLYEPVKFYYLGDRFLPEALIPYLLAYLLGIVWASVKSKKLMRTDAVLAGILTWLIVFLREPYAPTALLLFGSLLFFNRTSKTARLSVIIFTIFTAVTLLSVPVSDYLFTVGTVNQNTVFTMEASSNNLFGGGIATVLFYPFVILMHLPEALSGRWLYGLSVLYVLLAGWHVKTKKHILFLVVSFAALALAAIRYVPAGAVFYEAFHMLPWLGLFIMTVSLLVYEMFTSHTGKIRYLTPALLVSVWLFSIVNPKSYLYENIDTFREFTDGYAHYQRNGDVIKKLSQADDTVFVELWDDIMYWQTGLDSSYQYGLYTPLMAAFPRYTEVRNEMFAEYPPDFYYCSDGYTYESNQLIPEQYALEYIELIENNEPSCIFIHRSKLHEISEEQWKMSEDLGFTLPSDIN
ncbi:MAG: hypothetical protein NUV98_05840 [Candidatus Roizmanbacteria bacterium]|nr:hypothetical protein [Candidatus Roizmanbacteria bacterium]